MQHTECAKQAENVARLNSALRGGLIVSNTLSFDAVLAHMNHLGVQRNDAAAAILSLIDEGDAAVIRHDDKGILQRGPGLKSAPLSRSYSDCLTFLKIESEVGHA